MAQANQARGSRNLPGAGSSTYADILYARLPNLTRATFSEQPEVLGCATRMLTGFPCVGPTTVLAEDVRAAVAAVSKLGFVGLTERWTESVCLFHRTFGLPRPKRAQALNSRAGNIYGEEERGAARDPADEAVYAEAARVFAAKLRAVWVREGQHDVLRQVLGPRRAVLAPALRELLLLARRRGAARRVDEQEEPPAVEGLHEHAVAGLLVAAVGRLEVVLDDGRPVRRRGPRRAARP